MRENFWRGFLIALSFALLVGVLAWPEPGNANLYPAVGIVAEVDHASDTVTMRDPVGHLWAFFGAEDWQCGDIVAAIMDSNGTESIFDDAIVCAEYAGTSL